MYITPRNAMDQIHSVCTTLTSTRIIGFKAEKGVKKKKKFHNNHATFTNPNTKLGIMWKKNVYVGTGLGN